MKTLLWLAVTALGGSLRFSPANAPAISGNNTPARSFFRLGDQLITFEKYGQPEGRNYFLVSLHANETELMRSAASFAFAHGAAFYRLSHGEGKNVEALLRDRPVSFDPNNIFTSLGRRLTLKENRCWNMRANQHVQQLAQFLLNGMDGEKTIVAVQQTEAAGAADYTKGGRLAKYAREIYLNPAQDAGDFCLTSDEAVFNALRSRQCNVVLLNRTRFADDGTLIAYGARSGRPCISVYSRQGHAAQQAALLSSVDAVLQ